MPNATRGVGLGTVLVLLTVTLAIGFAIKAPCISGHWADGRQYARLCYSDLVHQPRTEQLVAGRLPYLEPCDVRLPGPCDEYPVLTMWTMRVTAWSSGHTISGYVVASSILLALAAGVIAGALYLSVGGRALYFVLAPTLALYATMNWDLVAVALATVGTLTYLRRRDGWTGVLLGLGAAAKLYPALLVLPFAAGRFLEGTRERGTRLVVAAAGTWIAVNLPFAILSPSSWWEFFRFNVGRVADWDSIWYVVCERTTGQVCGATGLVNAGALAMFLAWAAAIWAIKARRDPGFARWTLGFPILVAFLLTNKVYSPQFSLWLLPWFALALPNPWLFAAFEISDVAVFVTRFSFFGTITGVEGGLAGLPIVAFETALIVRAIVLVACVVTWIRQRDAIAEPAQRPGTERAAWGTS